MPDASASNVSSHNNTLWQRAASPDSALPRQAAEAATAAPTCDTLRQWAASPDPAVRRQAAEAATVPADLLETLAHDSHPTVLSAVAQNANTPLPVITLLAEDYPAAVLANPARDLWMTLHPGWLNKLSLEAVAALLQQGPFSPDWMQWAVRQPQQVLAKSRRSIAQRTGSLALLTALASDCDAYTRLFVSRRVVSSSSIITLFRKAGSLDTLTNDGNPPHPLTTAEQVQLFEAGPWGRWLLARHPGTGEKWLRRLASSFPDEICIRMEPMSIGLRPQRDTLKHVVADHESTPSEFSSRLNEGRYARKGGSRAGLTHEIKVKGTGAGGLI